jgi:exodeoxyribonuclease V alpha subunit
MSVATEADREPAPEGWQQAAELLTACRVPARFAGPAVARLGSSAAEQLRADPWLLLSVPPIRPDQADWFARQVLGGEADPQDERRGRALVGYLLDRAAQEGNTAVPAAVVGNALGRLRISDPATAIVAAVNGGTVLPFETPPGPDEESGRPGEQGTGGTLLALARYAMAEEAVAEGTGRLAALAEPLDPPGGDADPGPDRAQLAAVAAVAGHGVTVLTGGPGTGQDRALAAVLAMAAGHGLRTALAAPTRQAAHRLAAGTGAPAATVPELLGEQPAGRFRRHEDAPLDADLVVVTEAEMLDAELAAALIEACPDGSRLLLAGDPAQLPSAGPGRVLADLIDSAAIPVTELAELTGDRPGRVIAGLASAVRAGSLPSVDAPDREVVVVGTRSSAEASHRVIQLVTDSIPRALGISGTDIQVITLACPGPAGVTELNRALKQQLNPGPGRCGGFDPGDRVLSVGQGGLAAGELGTVTGPGDGGLLVEFPGGPVCVPDRLLGGLRPGWALTPRRAQGSVWPAVVAVFPEEAAGMLTRPLVYTALTRAGRHLSVVQAAGPALARAVAAPEQPRLTRLAGLLAQAAAT